MARIKPIKVFRELAGRAKAADDLGALLAQQFDHS